MVKEESKICHIFIHNTSKHGVEGDSLIDHRWRILLDERHKVRIDQVNASIAKRIGPVQGCGIRRTIRTISQDGEGRGVKSGVDSSEQYTNINSRKTYPHQVSIHVEAAGFHLRSHPIRAVGYVSEKCHFVRSFVFTDSPADPTFVSIMLEDVAVSQ